MLVQIEIHILIGIHLWWASHYLSMFVSLKDLPHPQVDQSYVCISRWWLHSQCKECTFVFWGWSGSQANQSVLCFQQGSTVDQGWPGKSQAVATQGNTVIVSRGRVQRERENIRILRGHYFQKYRMSLSTVCFFLWRSVLCPGGGWWASASNARLYFEVDDDSKRIGSWCAVDLNQQWLRIDLKQMKTITGIAIQGEIEWEDQHRNSPLRSLYICLNFRCEKELFHQSLISFFAWLWSSCVDT